MTADEIRKHPLLNQMLKHSDSDEMNVNAYTIAVKHTHYVAHGLNTKARFATYLTEHEVQDRKVGSPPAILVEKGTVYEQFRFQAALKSLRK